ncbi:hypothetical protein F4820DRAFT_465043 [Hypoxylon rubiginosum]|uniref:Uncharacterized protein n=1 Tax=Hypoxylon rubiginosum TaxID=110542 RepID=A0ACB9YP69_9PEZI|nr:hypothetical protein F4820DRAFT_465043 [Hypoxylon rubiginosum]
MQLFNKKRLYLAIYYSDPRTGHEDQKYRFGFIVGPKDESRRDHARGLSCRVRRLSSTAWQYEETRLGDVRMADDLLARVLIAKVTDEERLMAILREAPVQDDTNYGWCKDVVTRIANDDKAVGWPAIKKWESIEAVSLAFVCSKRMDGRYPAHPGRPKPTWNALRRKEIIH